MPGSPTDPNVEQLAALAAAQWPEIHADMRGFVQRLELCADAAGLRPSELAVRDLYLAFGVVSGDAAAAKQLVAVCERVAQLVARRGVASKVEELRQDLAALVTSNGESGAMRLTQYVGRSSLFAWLRTCAVRLLPAASALEQTEVLDDIALERFVADALGPASSTERAGVIAMAKRSLDRALAEMSERNRTVLRQKLGMGWSVDQIGEAHGVHRATAARWVESAKDELRADLLDVLRDEIGDEALFDSVCAQISDSLFATLARHLRVEV